MVGNDIIDISATRRAATLKGMGWQRPGFLQKIFTQAEQALIEAAVDPFSMVWQLWSMKESAYKIYMQAGGSRFYNPQKLECLLYTPTMGEVSMGSLQMHTETRFHPDYIFTTATLPATAVTTAIFPLPTQDRAAQSRYTHQQLLQAYAFSHDLDIALLKIQKTTSGVPLLHYEGEALMIALSMTHHGGYGAYSYVDH